MGLIKTILWFIIVIGLVIAVGQWLGWWDALAGVLLGSGVAVGTYTAGTNWKDYHKQSNWESYTKLVDKSGDTTTVRYVNEDGEIILEYETSGDPSETSLNEASLDNDIKLV